MHIVDLLNAAIVFIQSFSDQHPKALGLFFAAFFMLVFVGVNKQGIIALLAVLCANFSTDYLIANLASNDTAKAKLIYFAGPFIRSFFVVHLAEIRVEVAKLIIEKIKNQVPAALFPPAFLLMSSLRLSTKFRSSAHFSNTLLVIIISFSNDVRGFSSSLKIYYNTLHQTRTQQMISQYSCRQS